MFTSDVTKLMTSHTLWIPSLTFRYDLLQAGVKKALDKLFAPPFKIPANPLLSLEDSASRVGMVGR